MSMASRGILVSLVVAFGAAALVAAAVAASPQDQAEESGEEQSGLPKEIGPLKLGQVFDVEGEHVHTFADVEDNISYTYWSDELKLAINVEIDDENVITRLSWPASAEVEDFIDETNELFGEFFLRKEDLDDGAYRLIYEDEESVLRVFVRGIMIMVSISSKV